MNSCKIPIEKERNYWILFKMTKNDPRRFFFLYKRAAMKSRLPNFVTNDDGLAKNNIFYNYINKIKIV